MPLFQCHSLHPEDEDSRVIQNVGILLQHYMQHNADDLNLKAISTSKELGSGTSSSAVCIYF